jgi:lipoprotein-anchoring transpeptidase ErfK/SrfK
VATGADGSPTPGGVFKTTYKQPGWYTAGYDVYPVVRFYGGGYAFHSRLYWPGTHILQDGAIGYPVSHGCVRMYDEDIQWIYNNVPDGTTVVSY